MALNHLIGTWQVDSASLKSPQGEKPVLGNHPSGLLIFTETMHFSVVITNPDIPSFVSGDRLQGTDQENKLAIQNSLALFGTYAVDQEGNFSSQYIISSTFPNWNRLYRDTTQLELNRHNDLLLETMPVSDDEQVEIVWKRVN